MLKKLWEKMIAKFHTGEAKLDAETIAVLSELVAKIESMETYLANTPNHIGQVYSLPAEFNEGESAPIVEVVAAKAESAPIVEIVAQSIDTAKAES